MAVGDERAAYVALALTPGIGTVRLAALLEHFGSPSGALSAPFAFLCGVRGISHAAATALNNTTAAAGERALAMVDRLGARCLLPSDPEWPEALAHMPDAPTLLFAQGDLTLLERFAVAIVGSRDHSEYGAEICRVVASAAAEAGIAVVSGMARGLDAVAHTAALDAGGPTIGVLGNGLGVVYPAANRELYRRVAEEGLLLTEFPPGERPSVGAFPRRNRLISGLARVTVVVEAAEGSGTLITVGTALTQGRDVMAVPGNITSLTSVGTNRLIRDGAEPLLEVEDLLRHFPEVESGPAPRRLADAPESPDSCSPREDLTGLSPGEIEVWRRLREGPSSLDDLISASPGAGPPEILAAVSTLELKGLVVFDGGWVRLGGSSE